MADGFPSVREYAYIDAGGFGICWAGWMYKNSGQQTPSSDLALNSIIESLNYTKKSNFEQPKVEVNFGF